MHTKKKKNRAEIHAIYKIEMFMDVFRKKDRDAA